MEGGGARKILQRQLYTFLSSKWGALLCLIGFFTLLNASFSLFMIVLEYSPSFAPEDIVYTWVNGSDPRHQASYDRFLAIMARLRSAVDLRRSDILAARAEMRRRLQNLPLCTEDDNDTSTCYKDADSFSRYADNEELRYSLRSIERFAPWIRRIYLVTNGQVPYWLNLDANRLTVVTHAELFPNASHLPTFSSPAIESHLHRIPGLSDKFLYLNDDVMFGNKVWPEDFFSPQLGYKVYLSWQAPQCAQGCYNHYLGDGFCDDACNTTLCDYDLSDCTNESVIAKGPRWGRHPYGNIGGYGRGHHHGLRPSGGSASHTPEELLCARTCVDKACDPSCNFHDCGWDGGDCGLNDISTLPQHEILPTTQQVWFENTQAGLINLTALLAKPGSVLLDAVHTPNDLHRAVVFVPAAKIMVFAFHKQQRGCIEVKIRYAELNLEAAAEPNEDSVNDALLTANETLSPTPPPPSPHSSIETLSPLSDNNLAPLPELGDNNRTAMPNVETDTPKLAYDEKLLVVMVCASTYYLHMPPPPLLGDPGDNETTREPAMGQDPPFDANQPEGDGEANEDIRYGMMMEANRRHHEAQMAVDGQYPYRGNEYGDVYDGDGEIPWELQQAVDEELRGELPPCDHVNDTVNDSLTVEALHAKQRELLSFEEIVAYPPSLCRIRGTPLSGPLDAQAKRRSLASHFVKQILRSELELMREENRRMRRDRTKEEEISMLTEADRIGSLPPLRTLRESVMRTQLQKEDSESGGDAQQFWQKRKLLDAFGDSIRHVNRIYNRLYGVVQRSVPAHMPHFIDRKVMEELYSKFTDEFDETSSHHFRAANDMQYSFSYYYFLMSERKKFSLGEVWDAYLDADHDGELDMSELRTLGALSLAVPIREHEYYDMLVCVSTNFTRRRVEALRVCPSVIEGLTKWAKRLPRFPHTVLNTDDVAFLAVGDETPESAIDGIRERRHKFVCLNDDLSHTSASEKMIELLHSYYKALVPIRSNFELPDWNPNPYLHVDEMSAYRKTLWHRLRWLHRPRLWLYCLLGLSVALLMLTLIPEASPSIKAQFARRRFLSYFA